MLITRTHDLRAVEYWCLDGWWRRPAASRTAQALKYLVVALGARDWSHARTIGVLQNIGPSVGGGDGPRPGALRRRWAPWSLP